jgi:hypothetical protein
MAVLAQYIALSQAEQRLDGLLQLSETSFRRTKLSGCVSKYHYMPTSHYPRHTPQHLQCATIIRAQCSCNCFDTRRSFALKIVGSWTLICKGKQILFRVLYRVTRVQSQL